MLVVIIILIFLLASFILLIRNEHMVNIPTLPKDKVKWAQDNNCNYKMTEIFKQVLKNNNIKKTNGSDWLLYIPCSYNDIANEIAKIKPTNKAKATIQKFHREELLSLVEKEFSIGM